MRKLLYDYQDVLEPESYSPCTYERQVGHRGQYSTWKGYKEYDEEGYIKLQQIIIFKKLGLERKDIKNIMASENYDCNAVINEQLEALKAKREEIDNLIFIAEQLKAVGIKNGISEMFSNIDINRSVPFLKEFTEIICNKSDYKTKIENISEEQMDQLEKYSLLFSEEDPYEESSEDRKKLIREFVSFLNDILGIYWPFFTLSIVMCALGEGAVADSIPISKNDESLFEEVCTGISVFLIILEEYEQELDEKIRIIWELSGTSLDDKRVEKAIIEAKHILGQLFYLKTDKDRKVLWEIIDLLEEEYKTLGYEKTLYLIEAFRHYS